MSGSGNYSAVNQTVNSGVFLTNESLVQGSAVPTSAPVSNTSANMVNTVQNSVQPNVQTEKVDNLFG